MRKIVMLVMVTLLAAVLINSGRAMVYAEEGESSTASKVQIQTITGPTVATKLAERVGKSWSWYLTRASGLVAALSLILLMISGIGQVTGFMFRILDPITSWASHRALGLTFAISVIIHIVSILLDKFVHFSIANVLIPFSSSYRPVKLFGINFGSLYVALGISSFYMAMMITLTSLLWIDKKPKLWKLVHWLSYVVMFEVFLHALNLGTDLAAGFLRWAWIALAVAIIASIIHRLIRARTT
ncbi:MAG: ferric reductase-like transmembrane domain-containing protein [Candidatus Saccharibacteria bacterium]